MTPKTLPRFRTPGGASYSARGTGEPLILVHGVGLRLEAWRPQIEVLSANWHVIAVDLPGHGESDPIDPSATLSNYVDWLAAVIIDLDLGSASVAGHSMGALMALGLAASRPELVHRLAVFNGVYGRSAEALQSVRCRAARIRDGEVNFDEPLNRWFGDTQADRTAKNDTAAMLRQVNMHAYATAYSAFAEGDELLSGRLSSINCPALFLTGRDDPNSTGQMTRTMADEVRDGVAVIVDDHRHMVGLTAPGVVNAAMCDWLKREEIGT
jgi:pimeloyl-ACP methyl ester carboxylesterase